MIVIPVESIILVGLTATVSELYAVLVCKNYKNIGGLVSFLYLTFVYVLIYIPQIEFHGQAFVRVGVFLICLDKSIIFFDYLIKSARNNKIRAR